jgi:arabinogalactan oligomer/maltooligosaccharide transport system permease protein
MRKVKWWQQLFWYGILMGIALFVILPMWSMLRLSLDGAIKSVPTSFRLWPEQFTFEIYRQVWKNPAQSLSVLGLLRNSLVVSGGAALTSVGLGSSMAYAFARFRFPGRDPGLMGLLVGALLPPVALMTPLYILLSIVGLRTTLLGLMIVYTAFSMPFCVWNMRAAFQSVPMELEEAAVLDGATFLISFWRITLPLALPSIAVAALLSFLVGYSEFAIGWLFVESSDKVTLAMAVSGMRGASWAQMSALAILMSLPVVLVFLFLHRYLLRGLLIGGIRD